MAAEKKYFGHSPVAVLADNKAFPNNSTAKADAMCYVGSGDKTNLKIKIYCNDEVTLDENEEISFDLHGFATDTIGSAVDIMAARGTQWADSFYRIGLLHGISGNSTIPAGSLLFECPIPMEILKANGHKYITVAATTTGTYAGHEYTAIVVID